MLKVYAGNQMLRFSFVCGPCCYVSVSSFHLGCSVFGSDKRSAHMPIQISTVVVAHNALWVGTENGVLLTFPFNAPTLVTEETGWEVIKVCTPWIFIDPIIEYYFLTLSNQC